jgi:cell division transport system permease protein
MKIRTLRLLTREGAKNVYKNKLMSFASLATIIATLFVLGLILLVVVNVTANLEAMKRDLEVIFYLKVEASVFESEEVALFIEESKASGIVDDYRYESREQAFENAKRDLLYPELAEGLTAENFSEGYFVKLKDPAYSDDFITKLKMLSGVNQNFITYNKQALDRLSGIINVFNYSTIFVLVVLAIISVLLISNTIRLTVFARRKEIEIMKYVGALDRFIRFPFIVEGMLLGLLGALLAFLLTSQTYSAIKDSLESVFASISLGTLKLIEFNPVALRVLVVNILFGMTIGIIGSYMSVRKHLNV